MRAARVYGASVLLGRRDEREQIERLLDRARYGVSGVLVVRGEAGIGKTTLLRYARDLAEAMTVVSATGVEAEAELEYSALLELTRPLLHLLAELPPYQAEALREALGLAPPRRRDRFAIGAALLSLVAAAAEERPLLVLADDAQWLDRASIDALQFASRRLLADRVAFLFALRADDDRRFETAGFDVVELEGLDVADVGVLLERAGTGVLAGDALRRVREATGGNPLALGELATLVSGEELAAWRPDAEPLPVGAAVRRAFARQAEHLHDDTRRALVVAAVAAPADVDVVGRALTSLALDLSLLEAAEDLGLVSLERGLIAFRHPLIRATIHQGAPPSERRAAHAALAEVLGETGLADRRAWHLAAAALGPDEATAAALESVATRARARGGHAAGAAALEHAARLSEDDDRRLGRLQAAAEAAWAGGSSAKAIALLENGLALRLDDQRRAGLLRLRGVIEHAVGQQETARDMLLEAAAITEQHDPREAAAIFLTAAIPLYFSGDVAGSLHAAERARELAPRDGTPTDARADIFHGWALSHAGRHEEAEEVLSKAVDVLLADESPDQATLQNLRLALDVLERVAEGDEIAARITALAREDGPLALLLAVEQSTRCDVRAGNWHRAVASGEEGLGLARSLGHSVDVSRLQLLLARVDAARGDEQQCLPRLAATAEIAAAQGLETLGDTLLCVRGLLELGLGKLDAAAETLELAARRTERRGVFARDTVPEPDLVEVLVALGRRGDAQVQLEAFAERGWRASPRWASALVARCRALLAGDDFERFFLEALDLHREVADRFQEARTLLLFGERLRRAGRKRDARERLRQALEHFDELSARPWQERTRAELRASGEKLRRAQNGLGDELTPQELQVALQVAEGKTNKQTAAVLFLSPKTIEFHLASVYRKLGVASRRDLIKLVSAEGAEALARV